MADNPLSYAVGAVRLDDPNWIWPKKLAKPPKLGDLNEAIDRSVQQGGYWEKGTFTVPAATTEERVQLVGHKYLLKFGDALEAKGLKVHQILGPVLDKRPMPVEPDRRRYRVFAWVSQRPFQPIYDIPDEFVPEMLKAGLRLLE